jgi:uracil-DNA glycosylase
MYECRKCEQFGLRFERAYSPQEYIEGNRNSKIWIVGLNPAIDPAWGTAQDDLRTAPELQEYFDNRERVHSYFRDFAAVSRELHDTLGKPGGTAHTDLVKCRSKSWPPPEASKKDGRSMIDNCRPYFLEQLRQIRPAMIVCNGAPVCEAVKELFPIPAGCSATVTSYVTEFEHERICIILSGFIGRIDNYAKRRLGAEIESRLRELCL